MGQRGTVSLLVLIVALCCAGTATAQGIGGVNPDKSVAAGAATYTVARGDTISELSLKLIGTSKRWRELWLANKDVIKDPNNLKAGTVLVYGHLVAPSAATNGTPALTSKPEIAGPAPGAGASVATTLATTVSAPMPSAPLPRTPNTAAPTATASAATPPPVTVTPAAEPAIVVTAEVKDAPPRPVEHAAEPGAGMTKPNAGETGARSSAKKPAPPKKPPVDLIMNEDAVCTVCHDETDDFPVLSIAATKHGTRADRRTPTCVSCHGESKDHLKVPKGSQGQRPLPDLPFGRKTLNNVAKHNQSCQQCHQGEKLTLWAGSPHSRREVACSQCHKLHTPNDRMLSRQTVSDGCMNCHTEKRAMINRPSRHPIIEAKVVCTDCHAAHGSAGPKLMVRDSVVQTCYTCHMEKRGPYLWNHLPVTQDCSICHNPHGSTNPNLLKQRPPYLCQQCHEPTSHRGNMPTLTQTNRAFPGGGALNPFGGLDKQGGLINNAERPNNLVPAQARACLNCHSNIHGGNNPTNTSSSRSLRR